MANKKAPAAAKSTTQAQVVEQPATPQPAGMPVEDVYRSIVDNAQAELARIRTFNDQVAAATAVQLEPLLNGSYLFASAMSRVTSRGVAGSPFSLDESVASEIIEGLIVEGEELNTSMDESRAAFAALQLDWVQDVSDRTAGVRASTLALGGGAIAAPQLSAGTDDAPSDSYIDSPWTKEDGNDD